MSRLHNSSGLPGDLFHSTAVNVWTTDMGKRLHCCSGVNKIPCYITRPSNRAGPSTSLLSCSVRLWVNMDQYYKSSSVIIVYEKIARSHTFNFGYYGQFHRRRCGYFQIISIHRPKWSKLVTHFEAQNKLQSVSEATRGMLWFWIKFRVCLILYLPDLFCMDGV